MNTGAARRRRDRRRSGAPCRRSMARSRCSADAGRCASASARAICCRRWSRCIADPPRDAVIILEAGDLKSRQRATRTLRAHGRAHWAVACYGDAGRKSRRSKLIDGELRTAGTHHRPRRARTPRLAASAAIGWPHAAKCRSSCSTPRASRASRVEDIEAIVGDASATGLDDAIDCRIRRRGQGDRSGGGAGCLAPAYLGAERHSRRCDPRRERRCTAGG